MVGPTRRPEYILSFAMFLKVFAIAGALAHVVCTFAFKNAVLVQNGVIHFKMTGLGLVVLFFVGLLCDWLVLAWIIPRPSLLLGFF